MMKYDKEVWKKGAATDNHFESRFQEGGCDLLCRRQDHFPLRLYRMLEEVHNFGLTHIISWSSDGRFVVVHKPKVFENTLMKSYFKHTKYKSFQRQMNLYQFTRTPRDKVLGVYSHPLFRRGHVDKCRDIKRPPKRQRGSSTKKLVDRLRGSPLETILSDIVPVPVEDNISSVESENSNTRSIKSLQRPVSLNLKSRSVRSVTNEDLTALEKLSSKTGKSNSQGSKNECNKHNGLPLRVTLIPPSILCEKNDDEKPFETNNDPLMMKISEFNLRDALDRNTSPVLPPFLPQEDDECSIGTIDSFSNIDMIG